MYINIKKKTFYSIFYIFSILPNTNGWDTYLCGEHWNYVVKQRFGEKMAAFMMGRADNETFKDASHDHCELKIDMACQPMLIVFRTVTFCASQFTVYDMI